MAGKLRVFPETEEELQASRQVPAVRVCLGDLLPLIALAQQNNYSWLQDFLEDEVCITTDLYEVLRAFQCYRPSA